MNIACIRHSQIPGSSKLFVDLLYHFDRVAEFYAHPPDLNAAHAAAKGIHLQPEHRHALVEALEARNAGGGPKVRESLDRLREPDTVVVATGQQVGLFGGPAFALYKALSAAKHAAALTEQGLPAVAVFWLATEDHDLDEIDHTRLLDASEQPRTLSAETQSRPEQPAGLAVVADPKIDELRQALAGLDFADETISLAEKAYAGAPTFGEAFARFFQALLADYGVILLDPLEPRIRSLAAPLIRRALEQNDEFAPALMERGRKLEEAGYHQQVQVGEETSLLFLMEGRRRKSLRRTSEGFAAGAAAHTLDDLLAKLDADPEAFSPNALLRPVLQDWLLPTVAFVAGPSELAYLAQSGVLYERLLGRAPVFLPRASFTVFDHRRRKLAERHGFAPADLLISAEDLRREIGRRLTPDEVARGLERSRNRVESALKDLDATLRSFDPTLAEALDRSQRKMVYQMTKIAGKVEREALLRDERAAREAAELSAWIYPQKAPQERYYGMLPFLARFGSRFPAAIYEAIRSDCPDHQALAL